MNNDIDFIRITKFNIAERSNIMIESIELKRNNLYITGSDLKEYELNNNEVITSTLNLGKILTEDEDIKHLNIFENYEDSRFNSYARLKSNDYNPEMFYEIYDFSIIKNKKILYYIKKWIEACGISNYYKIVPIDNTNQYKIKLTRRETEQILVYCMKFYNMFKLKKEEIETMNLKFSINYTYLGKNKFKKEFKNFNDVLIFQLLLYNKGTNISLNECAHCHNYFFGRSDKKCCSYSCKEYYNKRYLKKLIKKELEQEQKGKEKTENDTNNQQK